MLLLVELGARHHYGLYWGKFLLNVDYLLGRTSKFWFGGVVRPSECSLIVGWGVWIFVEAGREWVVIRDLVL